MDIYSIGGNFYAADVKAVGKDNKSKDIVIVNDKISLYVTFDTKENAEECMKGLITEMAMTKTVNQSSAISLDYYKDNIKDVAVTWR